jgi:hypothetical protein
MDYYLYYIFFSIPFFFIVLIYLLAFYQDIRLSDIFILLIVSMLPFFREMFVLFALADRYGKKILIKQRY